MEVSPVLIISIVSVVTAFTIIFTGIILSNNENRLTDSSYLSYYGNATDNDFVVVDVYMRPDNNFIQGLYYDDKTGLFWEGSGLYGKSKVRYLKLDNETKKLKYDDTIPEFNMDYNIFGEGICPLNNNQIVVLTW
jgi:glutamine cyclotransferase